MKIYIDDKVIDTGDTPIVFILSKQDKENIANMAPWATVYGCFPPDFSEAVREHMCKLAKKHDYKDGGS